MRNQLRLLRDVAALILIASTWRLWFTASDFPAVPFFSFLVPVPRSVDPILCGVLVSALLVDVLLIVAGIVSGTVLPYRECVARVCDLLFVVMAAGLILLNQHCLQPWMYHFLILTVLLGQYSPPRASGVGSSRDDDSIQNQSPDLFSQRAVLWLTASIYVWSAWSKLDVSFLQTHGPKFMDAICDVVGLSTRFWTDRTWQIAAAALPIGELAIGIALLLNRTRRLALAGSVVMHLLLMLAVGPWGLNHRAGVLLWNSFFMIQNLVLLRATWNRDATAGSAGSDGIDGESTAGQGSVVTERRVAILILTSAVLFPVFRSVGYCDTWPSWAVYASSPARVLVQISDDSVEQLPQSLQKFVEPRQINDGWSWLRIDRWSLDATGTPIYPQDRFQLGVARLVAQRFHLSGSIRIIHEAQADRWTGKRNRSQAIGEADIAEFGTRFGLNSESRQQ
jgi:hypothetical protein